MTKEVYECIDLVIKDISEHPEYDREEILKRHRELLWGTNHEVSYYELSRKIRNRIIELKKQNPMESTAQACLKRSISELEELLK